MKRKTLPGAYRLLAQLLFIVVIAFGPATAQSNSQPAAGASAQPLTNALIALNEQYQSAPQASKPQLLAEMQVLAARRQQLLLQLMQSGPGQVLRYAIPAKM